MRLLISMTTPEHIGVLRAGHNPLHCTDCPRLVELRESVRQRYPNYHAAPVQSWGVRGARVLIVGLAPGMHGANATGRPFTGDASGAFLFESLYRAGFASCADASKAKLCNVRITNAVKCLPPANKPIAAEITACRKYLIAEISEFAPPGMRKSRCILCLGRVAHEAVVKALMAMTNLPVLLPFQHGQRITLNANLNVVDTYHPSRQNTNTNRLTRDMLDIVMQQVRVLL